MTGDDQENVATRNHLKDNGGGERFGRGRRRGYNLSLFDVLDKDYYEIFKSPEGKRGRASFSKLTYIIGVAIFLVGVIEGSVAAQFTKFRSLRDWQLYGLVLLTALVTAIVFVGFGKVVELIIYKSNKP